MGLLRKDHRHLLPAVDFMLKVFNVRKTLYIMGQWDLSYFLYIMDFKNEGDIVYIVGETNNELAASEYYESMDVGQ